MSDGVREDYLPRVVDRELTSRLAASGGVVIEGAKACGKTVTARQKAASEVLLDVDEAARRAVAIDPTLVLDGPTPRLIDEWQVEPSIWNHLRRAIDDRTLPLAAGLACDRCRWRRRCAPTATTWRRSGGST